MGYIFKYIPFLIVFKAVIMIAAALTNVINNVYGTKLVLDSVQQGKTNGSDIICNKDYRYTLVWLYILCIRKKPMEKQLIFAWKRYYPYSKLGEQRND